MWWPTPLILALRRERQVDLFISSRSILQCKFQVSHGYRATTCFKQTNQPTTKPKRVDVTACLQGGGEELGMKLSVQWPSTEERVTQVHMEKRKV